MQVKHYQETGLAGLIRDLKKEVEKARYRNALIYVSGAFGVGASLTTVSGYTAPAAYTALAAQIAPLFERLAAIFF